MIRQLAVIVLASALGVCGAAERPDWAFFVPTAASAALSEPHGFEANWTAPGSRKSYTIQEVENVLMPPDWYPEEHPVMPDIVARGSRAEGNGPPLLPCSLCHLPNGAGHVESASLAGLRADYIEAQFVNWRSGARKIAVGSSNSRAFLTALKGRYSTDQIRAAAQYFASLKPRQWIRVVETDVVPASAVNPQTLMRLPISGAGTEPLGHRIVELPEDPVRLVYRDSHSGFVAYVPKHSITVGQTLVASTESGLPPCTACHGSRLAGSAIAPPLAGRPPTYIVRQLWAYQNGDRNPESAAAMRSIVANLAPEQMVNIAAFLASRPPE